MQTVNVPCAECGQYHTIQVLCPATAGKPESPPPPPGPGPLGAPTPDWHRHYCEQKSRADRLDSAFAQADTARCKVEAELEREREISGRFQAENQELERTVNNLLGDIGELISKLKLAQDNGATARERLSEVILELDQARNDLAAANERHEQLRLAYRKLEDELKCSNDRRERLRKERDEARLQKNQFEGAANTRAYEIEKLKSQLSGSERAHEFNQLQEAVMHRDKTIAQLSDTIQGLRNKLEGYKKTAMAAQHPPERPTESELRAELDRTRAESASRLDVIHAQKIRIDSLEREASESHRAYQVRELQEKIGKVETHNRELINRNDELNQQLLGEDKRIRQLIEERNDRAVALSRATAEITRLRTLKREIRSLLDSPAHQHGDREQQT